MSQAQRGNSFVCGWEECNRKFSVLKQLVDHLSEDHVGFKKESYCCRWTDCPRANNTQASRFALISHIRSHTGEKPYTCPAPGCPREFTRSDSLNKHVKTHHPHLAAGGTAARGDSQRGSSQPGSELGYEDIFDPRGKSRHVRSDSNRKLSPFDSPASRHKFASQVRHKPKEVPSGLRDYPKAPNRQVSRIDSTNSNSDAGLNGQQKNALLKAKLMFIEDEREAYMNDLEKKRELIRLLKAEKYILLSSLKKLQDKVETRRIKRQAKKEKIAALKKELIDSKKSKKKPASKKRRVVPKIEVPA